jgi:hypothetical protein
MPNLQALHIADNGTLNGADLHKKVCITGIYNLQVTGRN